MKRIIVGGLSLLATVGLAASPDAGSGFDGMQVDRTIDPCNDFYAFVCSKWQQAHPIPGNQSVWSVAGPLVLSTRQLLRETMEQASEADPGRPEQRQRLGDYWAACMDEEGIERLGLAPIQANLLRLSRLKSKSAIGRELAAIHLSMPMAGADAQTNSALFGFTSQQDLDDASKVVAAFDQGGLSLPGREVYLDDDARSKTLREKYGAHLRAMFQLAGDTPGRARTEAEAVLRIETALARAQMDIVKRRDPKNQNNPRSLAQVKATLRSFDVGGYLAAMGAPATQRYLVLSPDFFAALDGLLRKAPLADLQSYLRWWVLHGQASNLSRAFVDEDFAFFRGTLGGVKEILPRWQRCVVKADRDLGEALGEAYVAKVFPPESKRSADALVTRVREALAGELAKADWMEESTRKAAEQKLAAIEQKIGYPTRWRDYSALTISRTSLVDNVRAASRFEQARQLAKIGKPVDRTEWQITPQTIDAYYDPQINTINFPAGILQAPFFDPVQGDVVSLGGVGVVMGHEIIHGFDDQGRKFDAQGNLRDWWTARDAERYDARGSCIAQQYTQTLAEFGGVKTNGKLTQGEDTADNGGMHLAYLALERAVPAATLDAKGADGLTGRQRFFAAYGSSWCASVRPEAVPPYVATNPHSLPKLRVNNTLANTPEFQKAYGCKAGPMVHVPACRVW